MQTDVRRARRWAWLAAPAAVLLAGLSLAGPAAATPSPTGAGASPVLPHAGHRCHDAGHHHRATGAFCRPDPPHGPLTRL